MNPAPGSDLALDGLKEAGRRSYVGLQQAYGNSKLDRGTRLEAWCLMKAIYALIRRVEELENRLTEPL